MSEGQLHSLGMDLNGVVNVTLQGTSYHDAPDQ